AAVAALSATAVLLPLAQASAAPTRAHAESPVAFTAQLDGQRLDLSSSSDPIVIDPTRNSILTLDMQNLGSSPTIVRQVQIRGTAFGITLMSFDVTINARVAANGRVHVLVPVEFVDLGRQADGLLPATIRLLDPTQGQLAAQNFTVDIQGSASSLMSIFTMVVAVATGLSIVFLVIAIGRRRLPRNRLQRGVRFAIAGIGVGITLTLFLSEVLLVTPKGQVWIPLLLVPAAAAFVLGFLSPGPLADTDEEAEVEDWMRATLPTKPGAN
ncbi:MAG TPA: hypothetical protein VGU73_05170, partial [Acidimicrobiia bacterium]|nr:hypothetical protein [Acidimicrobiia bacterium]